MSAMLYLRLSESELNFARYEAGNGDTFVFSTFKLRPQTSFTVNLREACAAEDLLKQPHAAIQVLVAGPVTPVPLADFQEEDCEAFYDFCFTKEQPRRVFYDVLPAANAVLLFALDKNACHALEETLGDIHYVSAQTAVLRHFSAKVSPVQPKRLFVHCRDQAADVAVFEESRLLMVNSYDVHSPVDTAYYVLNIARWHGSGGSGLPIYVTGPQDRREAVAAELRKYVKGVYPVNPASEFNRHAVAAAEGVPYDLVALLLER